MRKFLGALSVATYIGSIIAANYLISTYGLVSVGWGLMAPAGVFAAGVAFTARDIVQRTIGRRAVLAAIAVGAGVSWWISPAFAVASAVAFTASETLDMVVFTPLERKNLLAAVIASNTVGIVVDSVLFLSVAFGSLAFLDGQLVGKAYMTLAALPLIFAIRGVSARQEQTA